ncbi:hypothetical protein BJX61DRAFT_525700 [Aspergillus egyptiacus]|nr:hypothetical protein BJX61DRAFT_525700 [Aspergillus egyptiacus]
MPRADHVPESPEGPVTGSNRRRASGASPQSQPYEVLSGMAGTGTDKDDRSTGYGKGCYFFQPSSTSYSPSQFCRSIHGRDYRSLYGKPSKCRVTPWITNRDSDHNSTAAYRVPNMPPEKASPRFTYFSCKTKELLHTSHRDAIPPLSGSDAKEQSPPGSGPWWLDIRDATDEDVSSLARAVSLHPLTVEDILLQEPRQKIETFPGYYLISLRTLAATIDCEEEVKPSEAKSQDEYLNLFRSPATPNPSMLYILVFGSGTITFSRGRCEHATRVRSRINRLHDPSVLSSDWICYALIDDVIDTFQPHLESTSRESEAIQDQIFIARDDDMTPLMLRIYNIRKRINHLSHSLSGKSDVLNGFVKRCHSRSPRLTSAATGSSSLFPESTSSASSSELLIYLSDVQDHLVTIVTELAQLDEITSRLQSNFLAQTSVNNMRLSVRLNEGLSKVTVLATIFVPLHMVTGLFGMNVTVPGQDVESLVWFFGIVGVFVAVIVGACFVAVRMKLL